MQWYAISQWGTASLTALISYNFPLIYSYTRNTKICEPLVTFCFWFSILNIGLCTI